MKIKLLYFGQVEEKVGISSEEIEITELFTSDDLMLMLHNKYPKLREIKFNTAVNQALIKSKTDLKDGFEVALLPPFAGG